MSNLCLQRREPCLIQRCCHDSEETEANINVYFFNLNNFPSFFLLYIRADSVHNIESHVPVVFLAANV